MILSIDILKICPSLTVPHKLIGFFPSNILFTYHKNICGSVFQRIFCECKKAEIQREIPGSFVIRGQKQMNDIDNNLNKEGSQVKNLTEYTIKVYTGDKRGAGTDANVHIILFGNENKSEVFNSLSRWSVKTPLKEER